MVTHDAAGAQTWETRTDFFDLAHNLESEVIEYDDGKLSLRTNDLADAQAWLSEYSMYAAGGALMQRDTLFDDSSRRATVSDIANAETWTTQAKLFDGFGRLVEQSEINDDGTGLVQLNDVSAQSWASIYNVYTAGGQLSQQDIDNDNGTHEATSFDLTNSQAWSRQVETSDALGHVTGQVEYNDDGTRTAQVNDVNSVENWSSKYTVYTSYTGDQVSKQDIDKDDGTHEATVHDLTNVQAWSTQTETTDAQDRLTQQTQHNDDGTTTVTVFDAASANPWTVQASSYDASNNLLSLSIDNDNGTREVTYYDVGNARPWSSEVDYFNASNQLYKQVEANDNQSTTFIDYDLSGSQNAWSRKIIENDSEGHTRTEITENDNGTSQLTRYDSGSNFSWSLFTDSFDPNGKRIEQVGAFDGDGGAWRTIYNNPAYIWESWLIDVPFNVVDTIQIPNGGHIYQTWDRRVFWGSGPNGPLWLGEGENNLFWTGEGAGGGVSPLVGPFHLPNGVDFAGDGWDNPAINFDLGGTSFDKGFFDGSFAGTNFDGGFSPDWYGSPFDGGWFDDGWFDDFDGGWFDNGWFDGGWSDGWSFDSGLGGIDPVVLDLDGNGASIALLGASTASFDMDSHPGREHTAWVGGSDALLAIDLAANGAAGPDGVIDQTREIVFTGWAPGAGSDIAALHAAFDTNNDNRLSAADARFSEFRIWHDANHDGISQTGELRNFAQLDIESIDLTTTGPALAFADGSGIKGLATFTRTDGSKGVAADASFTHEGDAHPDAVQSNITVNVKLVDGATVSEVLERDSLGHLINWRITTTAASGRIDVQEDTNGDDEIDRTQASWTDGNGKTVVQKDFGIGGVLLSEIATTYQSGALTSRTAIYADGSSAVTQHDVAGAQPWTTETSRYNDPGQLTSRLVAGDDGFSTETVHDVDDTYSWSTRVLVSVAAGLVSETLNLENGTKEVRTYDPLENVGWSQLTLYDAANHVVSRTSQSDDGSTSAVEYDVAGAQAWSDRVSLRDSLDRLVSVTESLDVGGSKTTLYDVNNNQLWTSQILTSDAFGNLLSQDSQRDNGTRTLSEYDEANQYNWVSRGSSFDASGARTSMFVIHDEGWLSYAPTGATLAGGAVHENAAAGTLVGTATGIDPDAGAVLSYALTDSAGGRFTINAATGAITVASGAVLNYAAAASHGIIVRVTDQTGLSYDKALAVAVTNTPHQSSAEDAPWSYQVAAFGNATTYTAALGDGSALPAWLGFTAATRTFAGTPPLNFNGALDLKVTGSNGTSSTSVAFRLTVIPVNDAPTIVSNGGGAAATISVAENTTAVTTVTATDPDSGSLTYSILTGAASPDAALFGIDAATGALSFNAARNFEAPGDADHNNSYVVQVRASDGSLVDDQTITVNLLDVPQFDAPALSIGNFNPATGWVSDNTYPRHLADVNGDGMADIVGFGATGVYVSLATGGGSFAPPVLTLQKFSPADGWSSDNTYPRQLADVNDDGMADIVGFGTTGVYVSLATGNGSFANSVLTLQKFSPADGWSSDNTYPRKLADVNGDHMADIVGFGSNGVYVSLATGGGSFANSVLTLQKFSPADGWSSDNIYPRELADVNGDGMADIVGFGAAGAYVSLATGGGSFATSVLALAAFSPANGWSSDDAYPRELADVNGDGMADIVGFGATGAYVSLATGGGSFAAPAFTPSAFNYGNGWTSQDQYPRHLADINFDHAADLVGFGPDGVYTALARDFL